MKRFFLLCPLLFFIIEASAQGELPVEMYTGRPFIFVPLASISSHEISDQVGLSYDATGIRVNQPSGNFGLGWRLNGGGTIKREVRGLPDDWTSTTDARRGWFMKNPSNVTISYEIHTGLKR